LHFTQTILFQSEFQLLHQSTKAEFCFMRIILTILIFFCFSGNSFGQIFNANKCFDEWSLKIETGPIHTIYKNNEFAKEYPILSWPNWNVGLLRKLPSKKNALLLEVGFYFWDHGTYNTDDTRTLVNQQLNKHSALSFGQLYTHSWAEMGTHARVHFSQKLTSKLLISESLGTGIFFNQRYNPLFEYSTDSLVFGNFQSHAGLNFNFDFGVFYPFSVESKRLMIGLTYELNAGAIKDQFTVNYGSGDEFESYASYQYSETLILFRQRLKLEIIFSLF
jgi:hypothetical protein